MHEKAKMRRLFLFLIPFVAAYTADAQNAAKGKDGGKAVSDSIALEEVVVESSRTIDKGDALRLMPSDAQKTASTTGYGLLARLALPNVTVDEVTKEITVPPSLGLLQVLINDVVADRHDLVSLNPKSVRYVDFIRNPGVRYGQGVNFVINIVTERARHGYTVGTELMQTLTAMRSSGDVFAKVNRGKGELGVNYSFGYVDMKEQEYEETADYLMPDNSVFTMRRTDNDWRTRQVSHDLQLQYTLADTSRYTLQATVGGTFSRIPRNTRTRTEVSGGVEERLPIRSADDTKTALADLYFNYNLTKRQNLTFNASGSYTASDYDYSYGGSSPYAYTSASKARTLFAEAVYENSLRPFTLSAGAAFDYNFTGVDYHGDTEAHNSILTQGVYMFAQIKGRLANLSYTVGTGVSYRHYHQGSQRNDYWLWRPELQLSWSPWRPFRLSYNVSMTQKPPRLAYLGDAIVRNNAFEFTAGNPALRPNKVIEQSITASLQLPSLYTQIMTAYRKSPDCTMPKIERMTADDGDIYFLFTRTNQPAVNLFYVNNYTRYDVLPGKLSLNFMGGLYRCFNFGDDYTHHSSAFNWSAGADAYLGRLSLSAYVDNGWNFLEGETKNRQATVYYLTASYRLGDFNVSLFWQHCFQNRVKMNDAELLKRYVHKTMRMYSGDLGNMLTLSLTWRLSRGREHKSVNRNAVKRGGDTGIIKN